MNMIEDVWRTRYCHPTQWDQAFAPLTLPDMFLDSAQRHPDAPFLDFMGRRYNYADVAKAVHQAAAGFEALGIKPGDRVGLFLPNVPHYVAAYYGALLAGAIIVNFSPLYTVDELAAQARDSGTRLIVTLSAAALLPTAMKVLETGAIERLVVGSVTGVLPPVKSLAFRLFKRRETAPLPRDARVTRFSELLANDGACSAPPPKPDDVALIQYTGGTTGLSKGAVLTHRNIVAAILQAETWFAPALERMPDLRKVNSIAALPLYHIFALTICFLAMRQGSHLTLVPNPRDFAKFIETLKKRPFHMLPGVNTLFNALLQHPMFKTIDFSHLCLTQAGGMAASEGTARAWQAATGSAMIEGWGMSETCAIGTNNPVTRSTFSGTIGLPLPSIEVAIKDDDGNSMAQGESGEICIRGPNVMVGYYMQEEETRKAFTPDGFMRTGDVGIMDEQGYFRIVDRKKDMIIVSGFNVFPSELENVISLCPGVIECAAVGIPDEMQGETIKVFVVRSDSMLTEDAVTRYCHDNLTGYKRPKYIEFRDELPKSNVGKILRRELRSHTH
jgi:acyl-CoA synthetase (AMP-forming)/AMP-acid ligase II